MRSAPTDLTKSAAPQDYILWYRNYDSPAIKSLLTLAFEKTPEYGPYRIRRSPEMVQGRVLRELSGRQEGDALVTIANVASSPERERELHAIPLPIDGGLLGFRVCVVRKDRLKLFEGVSSLEDLSQRNISIGQGTHWPDSAILQVNGVRVVTQPRFENLFTMLQRGRFDCFARGVSEVLFDLEQVNDQNLVIEPDLLLAYPMPSYFFVGPDDHETAQRIRLGLERAIRDGSFALFLSTYYGAAVDRLKLDRRKLLLLDNPYLTHDSDATGRQALRSLRQRISRGLDNH